MKIPIQNDGDSKTNFEESSRSTQKADEMALFVGDEVLGPLAKERKPAKNPSHLEGRGQPLESVIALKNRSGSTNLLLHG
jgi:hypothetical protein